jgi:hypothetical protein
MSWNSISYCHILIVQEPQHSFVWPLQSHDCYFTLTHKHCIFWDSLCSSSGVIHMSLEISIKMHLPCTHLSEVIFSLLPILWTLISFPRLQKVAKNLPHWRTASLTASFPNAWCVTMLAISWNLLTQHLYHMLCCCLFSKFKDRHFPKHFKTWSPWLHFPVWTETIYWMIKPFAYIFNGFLQPLNCKMLTKKGIHLWNVAKDSYLAHVHSHKCYPLSDYIVLSFTSIPLKVIHLNDTLIHVMSWEIYWIWFWLHVKLGLQQTDMYGQHEIRQQFLVQYLEIRFN